MSPRREELPRQVAAVCYRQTDERPQFLLVRTFDGKWTFPKGQIERGMSECEAAETEAFEEAGATGPVEHEPFTSYVYAKGNSGNPEPFEVEVHAYLMAVRKAYPPQETFRNPQWFAPQAAKEALAEGRIGKYAREFARVIDAAVERLRADEPL